MAHVGYDDDVTLPVVSLRRLRSTAACSLALPTAAAS